MASLYEALRSALSRVAGSAARQEADQAAILRRVSEVLRAQRGLRAGGQVSLLRPRAQTQGAIRLLRPQTETVGQVPPAARQAPPSPPPTSPTPRAPAGTYPEPLLAQPAGPRVYEAPGGLSRALADFGRTLTTALVGARLWRQAAPPSVAPAALREPRELPAQAVMRPGPAAAPEIPVAPGPARSVPIAPPAGGLGSFWRGIGDRLLATFAPFGRLNRELTEQLRQVAQQRQRGALAALREPPSAGSMKRVTQTMEDFRRALEALALTARTAGERMFYRGRAEAVGRTLAAFRAASTMIPESQAPAFMRRVAPLLLPQLRPATFAEAGGITRALFSVRGLLGRLLRLGGVGGALIIAMEQLTGASLRHAEGLKAYSGMIAGGIARLELTRLRSDIKVAAATQEYAREFLSAQRRLAEAMAPLRTQTAKMGYQLATWWTEAKTWLVEHLPGFLRPAPQAPVPPEIAQILTALASGQFGGRKNWPPPRR